MFAALLAVFFISFKLAPVASLLVFIILTIGSFESADVNVTIGEVTVNPVVFKVVARSTSMSKTPASISTIDPACTFASIKTALPSP